jgi:HAD superfamily hydrolase (TIGR01509 family)
MLKYILWDHDGVLVDTEYWYFRSTQQALAEIQVYFDRDEYLEFMPRGQTMWDLARQRGVSEEVIAVHRSNRDRYYQEYLRTEDIEIPGVLGVLKKLSQSFSMAIVTTAKKVDFEIIHRDRTIVSYMDFVLANGDYARSKPAPDPYLKALERFDAQPHEAIVIEDSERGLRSAAAAGIECVVIENAFTQSQDFSRAQCVLHSIRDLPALLADRAGVASLPDTRSI